MTNYIELPLLIMLRTVSISITLAASGHSLSEGHVLPVFARNSKQPSLLQALSRLVQVRKLVRLEKGKYTNPKHPFRVPSVPLNPRSSSPHPKRRRRSPLPYWYALYNRWA